MSDSAGALVAGSGLSEMEATRIKWVMAIKYMGTVNVTTGNAGERLG